MGKIMLMETDSGHIKKKINHSKAGIVKKAAAE